jgi:hypothetical protein
VKFSRNFREKRRFRLAIFATAATAYKWLVAQGSTVETFSPVSAKIRVLLIHTGLCGSGVDVGFSLGQGPWGPSGPFQPATSFSFGVFQILEYPLLGLARLSAPCAGHAAFAIKWGSWDFWDTEQHVSLMSQMQIIANTCHVACTVQVPSTYL